MLKNDLFLKALRGEPVKRPPVWLMRQAGRYLPEFMALKNKFDFFTRCQTPELATKITIMPIDQVAKRHVWLLTSLVEMPDGNTRPYHKTRAPRRTPTVDELAKSINDLKQHNVEYVWVSYKLPLLVFLFPVIIPMALLGDITALILHNVGI